MPWCPPLRAVLPLLLALGVHTHCMCCCVCQTACPRRLWGEGGVGVSVRFTGSFQRIDGVRRALAQASLLNPPRYNAVTSASRDFHSLAVSKGLDENSNSGLSDSMGCFLSPAPPGKQPLVPETASPLALELSSLFLGTIVAQHRFLPGALPISREIFFCNTVHICMVSPSESLGQAVSGAFSLQLALCPVKGTETLQQSLGVLQGRLGKADMPGSKQNNNLVSEIS